MKKRKGFFKKAAGLCILLGILGCAGIFGLSAYAVKSTEDRILSEEEAAELRADCILVLGCGVRPDGTPSPMLSERIERGVELYHQGAAPKLLVSGDHGRKDYDEVNLMKRIAVEQGVPAEDVFMDHAGFSTYDSMYRAGAVFCVEKVLIVSQDYHLPRAVSVAEGLGLEAYGTAARSPHYRGQAYRDLREAAARAKDLFKTVYKPKPKFLGEKLPISGNGNMTNDT